MSESIRICFLDVDGVLNSEFYYREHHRKRIFTFNHWWWKLSSGLKWIFNGFRHKSTIWKMSAKREKKYEKFESRFEHFKEETCIKKLRWLDETCKNVNAKIVISSTWRSNFTIPEWNKVFLWLDLYNTEVVGVTGYKDSGVRGEEIADYLAKNTVDDFVILDDDSDMLESQLNNFFPTDNWCGLTPNTLYRIERHFRKESEYLCGVSISKNYL